MEATILDNVLNEDNQDYIGLEKGVKIMMNHQIKQFIGKDCNISLLTMNYSGVIKEVHEDTILVETKTCIELINIRYLVRISAKK